MKLVALNFIITTVFIRFFEASSGNNLKEDKNSACSSGLWPQGKVPYEISQQFGYSYIIYILNLLKFNF